MFKRDADIESIPINPVTDDVAASTPRTTSKPISVIGPTLVFKGELSADEDLVIEGKIDGTIAHQQKNLIVGKQGRIKADIHAKEVKIEGNVVGDIRGDERVILSAGSDVNGNISSPRVQIADGARFNGTIEMTARESGSAVTKLTPSEATKSRAGNE